MKHIKNIKDFNYTLNENNIKLITDNDPEHPKNNPKYFISNGVKIDIGLNLWNNDKIIYL